MSQVTRTLTIPFALLLLASLLGASRSIAPGDEVPDFTLQDTSGAEISLTSLRGRTVIVVFWRAEQERSAEALAALQSVYTEFKEQGLIILALSSDKDSTTSISQVKQSGKLTFPMLHDRGAKAYGDYGVMVIPSTFIIDKEGKLNYCYPGYRDDFSRQIQGRVEVLLGKKTLQELQAELQPAEKPRLIEGERKAGRYLKAGNLLLEKGMVSSAVSQYQKAIQEEPDLLEAHLRLGDIYLNQKETQKAEQEFKQAISLQPRSADAHAGLGAVFLLQGQLEKAEETLRIALRLKPRLARAHYTLGAVYEERNQIQDAIVEYKAALRILLKIEE